MGTLPPVQVTFWITALSPEPVCCSTRFQPGLGTNESIEKPDGTVRTIFVVTALSFSVGTARLYSWSSFESETGGLMRACASAAAAKTSAAAHASTSDSDTTPEGHLFSFGRHERRPRARPAQTVARRGGPRFASPREMSAMRGSGGSAAGAASTTGARRGRGGATRATARPARSAVRSSSRAAAYASSANGSCNASPGTNVGVPNSCHGKTPVCEQPLEMLLDDERDRRQQRERPRRQPTRSATARGVGRGDEQRQRDDRRGGPEHERQPAQIPVPGDEQHLHPHVQPRVREPVRERMRSLRAGEHQRHGDEPGKAAAHRGNPARSGPRRS